MFTLYVLTAMMVEGLSAHHVVFLLLRIRAVYSNPTMDYAFSDPQIL